MKKIFITLFDYIKNPIFLLIAATIIVRVIFLDVIGLDYSYCLKTWYQKIIDYGGFSSLKETIGNYPDSYMFLLTIGSYITKNSLIYIKVLSIIFDYIIGLYTYKIFSHFNTKNSKLKSVLILLLPGIFINSAVLGQCDGIYTAFLLMFIYYILKNKPKIALTLFGVAISFKIQALFIAPVMLYLLLTKRVKIRHLVFCIIGFLIFLTPSILFGKGLINNLLILVNQTSTYNQFVKSCPNIYSLIFLNYRDINFVLKVILTLIVIIATAVISYIGYKDGFKEKVFFKKLMFLSIFVPFFLPSMLDRYFYVANILIYLYYTIYKSKKSTKFIVFSSIAYSLPVFCVNFLVLNEFYIMFDWIIVSLICSQISLWIIYFVFIDIKKKENV